MTSDTIVGIVGAVVLTGAMIVVFVYEKDQVSGGDGGIGEGNETFDISWEKAQLPYTVNGAALNQGGEAEAPFGVPAYATHIHVMLEWDETGDPGASSPLATPISGPDTFHLELMDFNGSAAGTPQEDASGELNLPYPIAANEAMPANTTARGDTATDALASVNEDLASQNITAQGNWSWLVRLVATGNPMGVPAGQGDTSNTYTVTITIDYWKPVATART